MAMRDMIIGYVKGPKGDPGNKGDPGKKGDPGVQGPQGPLPPLTNNGLATVPGVSALDAVMGKTLTEKDTSLQEQVTQLNTDKANVSDLKAYQNMATNVYAGNDVYTTVKNLIEAGKRCGILYFTNGSSFPATVASRTGYIEFANHHQTNFVSLRCYSSGNKSIDGQMALNASGITWHTA